MARLPIDDILGEIHAAYAKGENVVVSATPGAGKTTRVAPTLLKAGLVAPGKKILMMQPRRLAAKAVAARIAEENNWKLGGPDVGYQVRFEKCMEKNTRLVIMTEGILARRLLEDSSLADVACVILDEFHERSIHTDLALALLIECQSVFRPDLKIIVMSATLETHSLLSFLPRAKLCHAEGQIFPLSVIYQPKADRRTFTKRLEDQVWDAVSFLLGREDDDQGNILIFLPGSAEIKWCREKLTDAKLRDIEILELHGSLSLDQQSKVLHTGQKRRIILSTNIAETSLTVPGVSAVIDSGLARIMRWDASRNVESLQLSRISLASAKQRAGRAARERPGRVYRLWSTDEELKFKAFEEPEIFRIDLTPTLLTLAAWGISDFEKFGWFESPPLTKIQSAVAELRKLRALDDKSQLTGLGRSLQRIPISPRFAVALLHAKSLGREEVMALALSLLEQKDPVVNEELFRRVSPDHRECDLSSRVVALQAIRTGDAAAKWGLSPTVSQTCIHLAKDLQGIIRTREVQIANAPPGKAHLGHLLWPAFADRLCRRRESGSPRAVMVGGGGIALASDSEVQKSEYFLAIELRDSKDAKDMKVFLASGLTLAEIKELAGAEVREEIAANIDMKTLRVQQSRQVVFRDLVLEGPYPVAGKSSVGVQELQQGIKNSILKDWPAFAGRFDALAEFELRIQYLRKYLPELEIEELSEDAKLGIAEATLDFARGSAVEAIDMSGLLRSFYPHAQFELMNAHAPNRLQVPSGRFIKLHYSHDLTNVKCAVKLQELFGLTKSPTILRNKVQIVFDLLSPRERPLQTTSDLASFWKNTYPELRAEMKIKYPRHPWPEDPLTAEPTHKLKPRK